MNRKRRNLILVLAATIMFGGQQVDADFTFGTPENLGPTVNTPAWERFPRISADGLCLNFLRAPEYAGNAEVWMATRATFLWERLAVPLQAFETVPRYLAGRTC